MVDIQTERVLEAFITALFDNEDDCCSKKAEAYAMLETIKDENNEEILKQIGFIKSKPCNKGCRHFKRS